MNCNSIKQNLKISFWSENELKKYEIEHISSICGERAISQEEKSLLELELIENIKENLEEIEKIYFKVVAFYEDNVYRFYHQSFKVYNLHQIINEIINLFKKIQPKNTYFNAYLEQIINESKEIGEWDYNHNSDWLSHTRPIVEAFLHMKYFLDMLYQYKTIKPSNFLPSGWAAILYLYYIR